MLRNVLLIRDPAEVVASYVRSRATVTPEDIGLLQQVELYEQLGPEVPVVDAADFLRQPEAYLRWLCTTPGRVHPVDAAWRAGPRDCDGVWAPYWYDAVLPPPASSPTDHGRSS